MQYERKSPDRRKNVFHHIHNSMCFLAVKGLTCIVKDNVPCSIFIFGKILGLMKDKFLQNLQMSRQYYVHCTQYSVFLWPIHFCWFLFQMALLWMRSETNISLEKNTISDYHLGYSGQLHIM